MPTKAKPSAKKQAPKRTSSKAKATQTKSKPAARKSKANPKVTKSTKASESSNGLALDRTPLSEVRLDAGRLVVVDRTTGEQFDHHPAELIVCDDLDRYRYSHSFIESYGKCQAAALFRRMKAPSAKIFALERGTVAHESIEAFEIDPTIDIVKAFDEKWKLLILDHYNEFGDDDKQKINGDGYEETKNMVEDWHYENEELVRTSGILPEDVEVNFKLPATFSTDQGTFKRLFTGKLDLVLWNKDRSRYMIFDYKTSANAPDEDDLKLLPQFTLYQWAATELYGKPPEAMAWYHLRGKHKSPEEHNPPLLNKKTGEPLKRNPSFGAEHPRVPECLDFRFDVPLRTDEQIRDYFQNLCMGTILSWETGFVTKTGRANPKDNCGRCQYKKFCDTYDLPIPKHVRILQSA